MNKKMITYVLGRLLLCEAALLILPLIVAVIYGDGTITSFLITMGLLVAAGLILSLIKPKDKTIYARDGLVIVSLSWIMLSIFGAFPFYLSGEIPNLLDAIFESVSAFTTTSASVFTNIETVSKSLVFWRCFSNWIGGMGVLVFVMAILPLAGGGGNLHIMRAESPGPSVGKLVPKSNKTARILYLIYIALTVLCFIFLLIGDMSLFDSISLAFSTAGTGGAVLLNSSVVTYTPYVQSVLTVFMILLGINFNFYFLLLFTRFKEAFKATETWTYIGIMAASIAAITVNTRGYFGSVGEAFRHAAFQVSAMITTTGYYTTDYNSWPELSRMILLMLMCLGACAGSTSGGFKISRVILLIKNAAKEVRAVSHPRSVKVIKLDGNVVAKETLRSTIAFFTIYVMTFCISLLIVSFDNTDMVSNISGVAAALSNTGTGFNLCGPSGSFSAFSGLSKIVFIFDMLLGRLEFFPMICLMMPSKSRNKISFTKKGLNK